LLRRGCVSVAILVLCLGAAAAADGDAPNPRSAPAGRDSGASSAGLHRTWPRRYTRTGRYLDYSRYGLFGRSEPRHDRQKLPMVLREGRYQHHPVQIAQYGLQAYSKYIAGQGRIHRRRALRASLWLVRNQNRGGAWEYRFTNRSTRLGVTLTPPWISSMSQGQGISLLSRMSRLMGRSGSRRMARRFLRSAMRALRPFRRSVSKGGVVARLDGHPIYEEYPSTPSPFVLNGFQFSLLGLYDLGGRSRAAMRLFHRGIRTLVYALPFYETGGRSAYDLVHRVKPGVPPKITVPFYHHTHVILLDVLNSASPHPRLRRFRDRWAARDHFVPKYPR
jgi:heparosan-N-sulfate-glucuronate 5-epimerase